MFVFLRMPMIVASESTVIQEQVLEAVHPLRNHDEKTDFVVYRETASNHIGKKIETTVENDTDVGGTTHETVMDPTCKSIRKKSVAKKPSSDSTQLKRQQQQQQQK